MKTSLPERVAVALLVEMASGNYLPNERFLSHRDVKRFWRVSSPTATTSLQKLVEWGIIKSRDRSGHYLVPDFRRMALARLNAVHSIAMPRKPDWQTKVHSADRPENSLKRIALVMMPQGAERTGKSDTLSPQISCMATSYTARAIFREAERSGVMVDFYMDDGKEECHEWIVKQITSTNAQGAVIIRRILSTRVAPMASMFMKKGIPVVTAYDDCEHTNMVSVNFNNVGIGYSATRRFLDLGHRRIGVVLQKAPDQYFSDRFSGSELAVKEFGDPSARTQPFFLEYSDTETDVRKRFARSFSRSNKDRPTALLITDVQLLTMLKPLIQSEHLTIPRDLSAIVCSTITEVPGFKRRFDIMKLDFEEVGRAAYRALEKLFQGTSYSPCLLVNPQYHAHGSTAARAT